jgi:hypothetical protein
LVTCYKYVYLKYLKSKIKESIKPNNQINQIEENEVNSVQPVQPVIQYQLLPANGNGSQPMICYTNCRPQQIEQQVELPRLRNLKNQKKGTADSVE